MTDADGRATRESLSQAVAELGRTSSEGDVVSIILIGHGSAGEGARFNVTGPDVSASEFAGWLRPLEGRRLTIVVATSASGEWIPALAAPGRIVVTATRTAFERNESVFHSKFAEAFDGDAADADKDGRVSILEAFNHAAREVQREYESSGRLQTEHALLDDDGNGEGSSDPNPGAGDGRLASRTYIGADPVVASTVPGADALLRERARLEQSVEALRARRDSMDASEYERVLERLVTRLAEIRRSLEPPEAES